jgi:hypothetical protein
MDLNQDFALTPDIIDMVRQFGCAQQVASSAAGGRLKLGAAAMVGSDIRAFEPENLKKAFLSEERKLKALVSELAWRRLGLEVTRFRVRKAMGKRGTAFYKLDLAVGASDALTIEMTKIGADASRDPLELVKERPSLCWLIDSRSPFFAPGLAEQLTDIGTVMSFRAILERGDATSSEIMEIIAHFVAGEAH